MANNPITTGWLDIPDENGILFAYALDGKGGGTRLVADAVCEELRNEGLAWVHLDREHPKTREWLQREITYLDPLILDALLAEETRPRMLEFEQGILLILRGVNLNENAEPHDMISVRVWIDPLRIITVRRKRLTSVRDIREHIDEKKGPRNAGDFLWMLVARLFERMEPMFDDLGDIIDMLEDAVMENPDNRLRENIIEVRQRAITLRRYIAPQKEVIASLRLSPQKWISPMHRRHLQESYDHILRYTEDLDNVRERAQVIKDELTNVLTARLTKNTYVLSVITSIFIPLTFVTGLLGMNVAGIPVAEHINAFWIVTCICGSIMAFQIVLFKWLRWF